jgi:NAD-dependent deacetylase
MNIFVLTGAGVSAESGLGTFRNKERTGLWARFDPLKLATPEGFARDPDEVHAFYNARRLRVIEATPNAAHLALARLDAGMVERGDRLTLVTQNIDDLHERAGSRGVVHMHGELLKARCGDCQAASEWRGNLGRDCQCPTCGRIGAMRPHVVWFGEIPLEMAAIDAALVAADLFVSIGTSGAVYPAAGFVTAAQRQGASTCEINLEPSDNADQFLEKRYGPASREVPAWVEEILAEGDDRRMTTRST